MLDGWGEAEKLAWDRAAWSTAHVLNAWSRRRVTAQSLLGRPLLGQANREQSPEERRLKFAAVAEKIEQLRKEGRLLPPSPIILLS